MNLQGYYLSKRTATSKLSKPLKLKSATALVALALFLATAINSSPTFAGAIVGATEFTQIANNIQLVVQYAKQVQQYSTQLQQYQAQMQDLQRNPYSSLNNNVGTIINGVGQIMQAQNSIGGTMAQIDGNFAKTFKSDQAGDFATKFKSWTDTSNGTLNATMKAAGLHRDAYQTDAQALQALFNRSQSSDGTVAAVQQLSAITSMQVQQSQKLGDLLASQNIASSTWMAAQTTRDQAIQDRAAGVAGTLVEVPTGDKKSSKEYKPMKVIK